MDKWGDRLTSFVSAASDKVKDAASNAINRDSPLEKNLKEATSDKNWGCPTTILAELAKASFEYNDYFLIMKYIWEIFNEKNAKWRKMYKGLVLLEYLVKNGSERVTDEVRENLYKLRKLADYRVTEDGRDKAAGIREKCKLVCDLVNDTELLAQEREKARQNRDKYIGIGGHGERTGAGYTYSTNFDARDNRRQGGPTDYYSSGGRYDPYDAATKSKVALDKEKEKEKESRTKERDVQRELQKDKLKERERAEKSREKAKKGREREREKTRRREEQDEAERRREKPGVRRSRKRSESSAYSTSGKSEDSASSVSSSDSEKSAKKADKRKVNATKRKSKDALQSQSSREARSASLLDFDVSNRGGAAAPPTSGAELFSSDAAWGSFSCAPGPASTFDPFATAQMQPMACMQPPPQGRQNLSSMPDFFASPGQQQMPMTQPSTNPFANAAEGTRPPMQLSQQHAQFPSNTFLSDVNSSLVNLSLSDSMQQQQKRQQQMNVGGGSFGSIGPPAYTGGGYQNTKGFGQMGSVNNMAYMMNMTTMPPPQQQQQHMTMVGASNGNAFHSVEPLQYGFSGGNQMTMTGGASATNMDPFKF